MRSSRISCRRRLGRYPIAPFLALVVVVLSATHAQAYQARLRWLPSPDPSVIGYRVYVRQAFRSHTGAIDVGKPPLTNGTMTWTVNGLTSGRTYYFAVSAYSTKAESWFGGEIALGETDPCIIDRCFTPSNCELGVQDDGMSCGASPCKVCRQARCTPLPPAELETSGRLVTRSNGLRARVRGRFVHNGRVDPATTGVVLLFADRSGTMLLETTVPASAFKANRAGTRFSLVQPGVNGIERLTLTVSATRVRVSMLLQGYDYTPIGEHADLIWIMRFGADQCVIDPDLVCTGARCR
jgi:hypothetical protein